ncbi:STAS domain-containing protein [Streptomyces sp. NPDC029216]|uniref:STAS domain-containing protein n=1 Tax=Streptomyces sp. NPDC029216 TaxID=3154701 RepID=UPI003401D781
MTGHFARQPAIPADSLHSTLPLAPGVTADFEATPQRVVARLCGEIDLEDARGLREDLVTALRASRTGLDLDLSAVTFCDSSGLHLLLDLNRLATETGRTLVLTVLSRPVARLIQLTQTERVFTIREPALRARVNGEPATSRRPSPDPPAESAEEADHRAPRADERQPLPSLSPGLLPDIRDLCRVAIPAGTTVYGHAADSSFAHPIDP